ncbi:MAG TPA: SDR family oxidoreductase [Acidimicrobiia bacterium]|nr:SDR family oxidoreductase [Acidimicrobiia bacterium]
MAETLLAITGVTGGIGGRVADRLSRQGYNLRLIARDVAKIDDFVRAELVAGDYDDEGSMRQALSGASAMLFVSGREHIDRLTQHEKVVAAATSAGVRKIVYTSFLGASPEATFTLARQHYQTERFIRSSGAEYVFLRDSLYTDYIPHLVGSDGVIRGPAGSGRVSFVTRDDIADAAVAVLTTDVFDGQTFDITGPEAITLSSAAAVLSEFAGREISYVPETVEEAYASRAHYNAPDWEVEGWVTSYQAIANEEMETVSNSVETLTFHRPLSVKDFLAANPESYAHLQA